MVMSGTVAGVTSLADDSVKVQIAPAQQTLATLGGTASVHNSEVPSASVRTSGNSYTVRIDPLAIPAEDISPSGIVNFVVYVQDPHGARFGVSSTSVRAVVTKDGGYTWTDPDGATTDLADGESAAKVPAVARRTFARSLSGSVSQVRKYAYAAEPVHLNLPEPRVTGVICDAEGCAPTSAGSARRVPIGGRVPALHTRALDADGETESGSIDAPVISEGLRSSNCPVGGLGDVYSTKRSVSVTIGTAYPVGGDKAWMRHTIGSSAEYGATLGVASDAGGITGAFHQSSTRSIDRSVGFTWDGQTYARSFRVGVIYQKVLAMFDRCGGEPYFMTWIPIGYDGGFGENTSGVSRPDWTHCVSIKSVGRWDRSLTTGSAYTSSAGVKLASVIGLDLSSKRAYNAESILSYRIGVTGRRLCGSNTDPAHAAKVMERLRP